MPAGFEPLTPIERPTGPTPGATPTEGRPVPLTEAELAAQREARTGRAYTPSHPASATRAAADKGATAPSVPAEPQDVAPAGLPDPGASRMSRTVLVGIVVCVVLAVLVLLLVL